MKKRLTGLAAEILFAGAIILIGFLISLIGSVVR